ncbi:MAG: hypothetical protein V4592_20350 [Bacteroidota bacterium]
MGIFDFLKKKLSKEPTKASEPSLEQILFAQNVLQIIGPTIENYGFIIHKTAVEKYSTAIIYRKAAQYIKITGSTYPTDYPYYYNIILGEGDSDSFFESDWNAIALWRLKNKIAPLIKASDYSFPFGKQVKFSVSNANKELLKYGISFLNGDLTLFKETLSEQNTKREPYKVYTPTINGSFEVNDEPNSVLQKKKYT